MEKIRKIESEIYYDGIYDICGFLYMELVDFMNKEDRYYGKVKSYLNNIKDVYSSSNPSVTIEDIDLYGRVFYNLRKYIYKEFTNLKSKRLSGADRVIIIMKRLLDNNLETSKTIKGFKFERETRIVKKIIDKMYDNIRNKWKQNSLSSLIDIISECIKEEKWGKMNCDTIDLISLEYPRPKQLVLIGEETLVESSGGDIKRKEINF